MPPDLTNWSVRSNSVSITGTSSFDSPGGSERFTSQYTQSKLQRLSGFMFTPTDRPRARGEMTVYTNRPSRKSRAQPNAVPQLAATPGVPSLVDAIRFIRTPARTGFSGSKDFMFVFPHHQYRAGRPLHDVFRHTAKQDVLQPRPPVGGDDDEVSRQACGDFHNFARR